MQTTQKNNFCPAKSPLKTLTTSKYLLNEKEIISRAYLESEQRPRSKSYRK